MLQVSLRLLCVLNVCMNMFLSFCKDMGVFRYGDIFIYGGVGFEFLLYR